MKGACYFQACTTAASTKEHVPPKAFFPKDKRDQLITVPSCPEHNSQKSGDDMYALAQICMNASPANQARDVFFDAVFPQLGFSNHALRKLLRRDAVRLPGGAVKYRVDVERMDRFFSALSFGIVRRASGQQLPKTYSVGHVYHNFVDEHEAPERRKFVEEMRAFYASELGEILRFGEVRALNTDVYTVKLIGLRGLGGSITLVHRFYGVFEVTSMLSLFVDPAAVRGD